MKRQPSANAYTWRSETLHFLQELASVAERFNIPSSVKLARDWENQLRECRYNVVFMGRIKVGKSTLLNALLEAEMFPSSPIPLTPAITTFTRDQQSVVKWTENDQTRHLDSIGTSITAREIYRMLNDEFGRLNERYAVEYQISPEDDEKIASLVEELSPVTVEIRHDIGPYLEDVILVDTPGTGDLSKSRADVVYNIIPQADAGVVITSATQPLTSEEVKFIREELWDQGVTNLFFILSRIDALNSDEDVKQAINHVDSLLQSHLNLKMPPRLYAVSGYLALRAVQWRDRTLDWDALDKREKRKLQLYDTPEDMFKESRLEDFRTHLWQFLEHSERMAQQIEAVLGKVSVELRTSLQAEVIETERLLAGEGGATVAEAVRRIQELGKKASDAKKLLRQLDQAHTDMSNFFGLEQTKYLLEHVPMLENLQKDNRYTNMIQELESLIENKSFAELKGTDREQGQFTTILQSKWREFWGRTFDEITDYLEEVENEARRSASEKLEKTLNDIEVMLQRKLAIPTELHQNIAMFKKPWTGRVVGGTVGLVSGAAATLMTAGWGVVIGGSSTAMSTSLGAAWDERKGKGQFRAEMSNIQAEAEKKREELKKQTESVLNDLYQQIARQIEDRQEEIRQVLSGHEADAQQAEEMVQAKRQWLLDFQPHLQQLENRCAELRRFRGDHHPE